MNKFKRKSLYLALAAGIGAVGVAGSASAVNIAPNGLGQVLIYPYYTVRGGTDTALSVVNTTASGKAVKVRFTEGKNSREVLDFNLYLSPRDVWAAAIVPNAATGGAMLSVSSGSDNSCVSSSGGLYKSQQAGLNFNFTNNAYTGLTTDAGVTTGWDGGDQTLDRTREGYIEIIEMGMLHNISGTDVPSYSGTGALPAAAIAAPTTHGLAIATGITHNTAGVPVNCAQVSTLAPASTSNLDFFPATGGIMGGASIINVNNGSDLSYDPVVLEDFNTEAVAGHTTLWFGPGTIKPDLSNAGPFAAPISKLFYYHQAAPIPSGAWVTDVVTNSWGAGYGQDAVSAVLMRNSVMNSYVLDVATASNTDWVVTFPTKRHYISANNPAVVDTGTPTLLDPMGVVYDYPFADGVAAATAAAHFWNGFCNTVSMKLWDREESTPVVTTVEVSPPAPPGTTTINQLCWESNVITIAKVAPTVSTATLLGSKNSLAVTTTNEHGWGKLTFTDAWNLLPSSFNNEGTSYYGLPVVGFMAQDFNQPVTVNGGASTSVFGGNFNHRYTRSLVGAGVTP